MKAHHAAVLSDILAKAGLMALACGCAALLLRDATAIGVKVALDPNEGWNAYHALAAITGHGLYPATDSQMVNNYPPLSFYIVGAITKLTGDAIIAGRALSLAAFLATTAGIAAILRRNNVRFLPSLFAGLFFAAGLLIASDYVAMDDPQLLGHALQVGGLLLVLRQAPRPFAAALLFTAAVFIKHNLLSAPAATALWLLWQDRRQGLLLIAYGLGLALAGLLAFQFAFGISLLSVIASPRLWSWTNVQMSLAQYLSWAGLPLLLAAAMMFRLRRDSLARFCLLYGAIALVIAVPFAGGDGVDANIYFDLDIALALAGGMALHRIGASWRGCMALAWVLPLALFLARNFNDNNFGYTEAFRREAPGDIALLKAHPGPALCENLALCYWAGKPAAVDVFNMSEAFATGARSDSALVHLLSTQAFGGIQLDTLSPFALGRQVRAAMEARYRIDHSDDNGVFLVSKN